MPCGGGCRHETQGTHEKASLNARNRSTTAFVPNSPFRQRWNVPTSQSGTILTRHLETTNPGDLAEPLRIQITIEKPNMPRVSRKPWLQRRRRPKPMPSRPQRPAVETIDAKAGNDVGEEQTAAPRVADRRSDVRACGCGRANPVASPSCLRKRRRMASRPSPSPWQRSDVNLIELQAKSMVDLQCPGQIVRDRRHRHAQET